MSTLYPTFRLSSPDGRQRIYNAANHATVKDEASARAPQHAALLD